MGLMTVDHPAPHNSPEIGPLFPFAESAIPVLGRSVPFGNGSVIQARWSRVGGSPAVGKLSPVHP
jgi:hypothetical protein